MNRVLNAGEYFIKVVLYFTALHIIMNRIYPVVSCFPSSTIICLSPVQVMIRKTATCMSMSFSVYQRREYGPRFDSPLITIIVNYLMLLSEITDKPYILI